MPAADPITLLRRLGRRLGGYTPTLQKRVGFDVEYELVAKPGMFIGLLEDGRYVLRLQGDPEPLTFRAFDGLAGEAAHRLDRVWSSKSIAKLMLSIIEREHSAAQLVRFVRNDLKMIGPGVPLIQQVASTRLKLLAGRGKLPPEELDSAREQFGVRPVAMGHQRPDGERLVRWYRFATEADANVAELEFDRQYEPPGAGAVRKWFCAGAVRKGQTLLVNYALNV